MPAQDTKITALAAITTVDPVNDVLPIVDVSDNSMAASGTTKKITSNQILGAGGTATLASATISGDLTVRTNKLAVTSSGVGFGTTTPAYPAHFRTTSPVIAIQDDTSAATGVGGTMNFLGFTSGTSGANIFAQIKGVKTAGSAGGEYQVFTSDSAGNSVQRYLIDSTGVSTWSVGGTTAMTLNSTGLGVGGVSANGIKLSSFVTTDGAPATSGTTQTSGSLRIGAASTTGAMDMGTAGSYSWIQVLDRGNLATNYDLVLQKNGGNVGIGVTPAGTGGCLQLKSGITFPATQVASSDANTLDDYEEGTWTPVVIGTTTNGVGTYTNQVGFYTKIGNLVTVQAYITWTAHTATGNMRLSGLPFANSNTAGSFSSVCFGYVNNLALTAGNILTGFTSVGNTFIDCFQTPVGGGASTSVPIDTAAELIYTVTYRV